MLKILSTAYNIPQKITFKSTKKPKIRKKSTKLTHINSGGIVLQVHILAVAHMCQRNNKITLEPFSENFRKFLRHFHVVLQFEICQTEEGSLDPTFSYQSDHSHSHRIFRFFFQAFNVSWQPFAFDF